MCWWNPNEESRGVLQQLLGTVGSLWIAEVFTTYQGVAANIADIAPDLCLVNLDSNPAQALELIGSLSQLSPDGVILPASTSCDGALDAQGHPV